ncbi:hypothetical protein ACT3HK_09985, partial [Thermolongibacillus altinsuensis]
FGFLITFSFSLLQNGLWTTMMRSMIAFFSFFLIAYLFRWMFSFIQKDHQKEKVQEKVRIEESNNVAEIEHLFEDLSEEEQRKVVEYVRHLLKSDGE